MAGFVTKLDYSDNRQIKQFKYTETQLSGRTDFGVHYSALTGVDSSTLVTTNSFSGVTSQFSGNTTTTNFTFGDPRMVVASSGLYVITNVTSGDTQVVSGFEGVGPTIIDGNTVYSGYTGATYDLTVSSIVETGVNQWSGETLTNTLVILSGDSSDFTGRTIWVDVLGIARTKQLILVDEPEKDNTLPYVLGRNSDGEIREVYLSGYTNYDDYLTGGTFNISTGDLDLNLLSGSTVTINLDDRYSLTGHTHSFGQISGFTDNFITGGTFNTTGGTLSLYSVTGGTVNIDLDGRYALTGHTHATPNLKQVTDVGNWTPNDIYISGTTEKELRTTNYTTNNYSRVTPNFIEASNQANDSYFNAFYDKFSLYNLNSALSISGSSVSGLDGGGISVGFEGDGYIELFAQQSPYTRYGLSFKDQLNSDARQYLNFVLPLDSGDSTVTMPYGDGILALSVNDVTASTVGNIVINLGDLNDVVLTGLTHGYTIIYDSGTTQWIASEPTGGGSFNDDYVTGSTYNPTTGIINFTRLSGGTFNVDIGITSGDTTNWNTAYNDSITGITVSGSLTKTITLSQQDGGTLTANFTDITASGGTADDYTTGATFNTTNGILEFGRLSGDTYSVDLDGRYLTGYTDNAALIFSPTGNTSGIIKSGRTETNYGDVGSNAVDLSYGINPSTSRGALGFSSFASGSQTSATGNTSTASGYETKADGNYSFASGYRTNALGTYATAIGYLTTVNASFAGTAMGRNTTSSGNYSTAMGSDTEASGRYSSAMGRDNIAPSYGETVLGVYSTNGPTGSTTTWVGTDRIFNVGIGTSNGSRGDALTILKQGDVIAPSLTNALIDGEATGRIVITRDYLSTNYTPSSASTVNTDDYITSGDFNSATGDVTLTRLSGGTVVYNLDNRYSLTGHTHIISDITDYVPTDDFTTGTTFNTTNGILEFTRLSGGTYNVDLDGRYLTGFTQTDDYLTGHTFNTSTGLFESTLQSGSTVSVNLDGRYSLTGHTHSQYLTGFTQTDDYVTGATFNTGDGVLEFTRLSGGTFNIDLDGRYLNTSAYTDTNIFVTGSTFSTTNGLLEFTNTSGGTFNIDLDGRYAYLSGGTGGGTDDFTTGATFTASTGIMEFTRQSGTTYSVALGYEFDTVLSGWTFGNTGNTLTLLGDLQIEASAIPGFEYTFPDKTGIVALRSDINYLTGATFGITNGILSLDMLTGNTITVDLDDRYQPVSAITSNAALIFSPTGNTTGIIVSGRTETNYGPVGLGAKDLSHSASPSSTRGATGNYSFASGYNTTASGNNSTASGYQTIASGFGSTTSGRNTTASNYATASGWYTTASGDYSTSSGYYTTAIGVASTAIGYRANATGYTAIALGYYTTASGDYSTAMGSDTTASEYASTAMGYQTTANNRGSTATGGWTTASGRYSTASGWFTTAPSWGETSIGLFGTTGATVGNPTSWVGADRIFNVGNGKTSGTRSDTLTILKYGDVVAPSLSIGIINSADTRVLITKEYADANYSGGTDNAALVFSPTGNTTGIIISGRTEANYGPVGDRAKDLTHSSAPSTTMGVTGQDSFGAGVRNIVSGATSTAWGGDNIAGGSFATASGRYTQAMGDYSTASGYYTKAESQGAIVFGGFNTNSGYYGVISGGKSNNINVNSNYSFIGGGQTNVIVTGRTYSTITGGRNNTISGGSDFATIGGGDNSTISGGDYNTIGGGNTNVANGFNSTVAGGRDNSITGGTSVTISGGFNNKAYSNGATVGGGQNNTASGYNSTVFGGNNNTASVQYSTVSGGYSNTASGYYSSVAGGWDNTTLSNYTYVGGGANNTASGHTSSVLSGRFNVSGGHSSTASGLSNTARSFGETVMGIYTTNYTPISETIWVGTDRIFNIGNGTGTGARSDALTILKYGDVVAPSLSIDIINSANTKVLITKEYLSSQGYLTGATSTADDYVTGGTFNDLTGDLTLNRLSGGTVVTNLDNRYHPIHLPITQASHGFSIGDAVRLNGSTWVLAIADSPENSGTLGLVSTSADTNNFTVQTSGVFSGGTWTSGTDYFLSNTVSGSVVTEPTYLIGQVRQYIGTALSTNELLLEVDLGDELVENLDNFKETLNVISPHNIDWYYETHRITLSGNTTLTDSNYPTSGVYSKAITIYVSGDFTLTLPAAWQTYVTGTYDGGTLNQIVVEYIKSGLYWVDINRAD